MQSIKITKLHHTVIKAGQSVTGNFATFVLRANTQKLVD